MCAECEDAEHENYEPRDFEMCPCEGCVQRSALEGQLTAVWKREKRARARGDGANIARYQAEVAALKAAAEEAKCLIPCVDCDARGGHYHGRPGLTGEVWIGSDGREWPVEGGIGPDDGGRCYCCFHNRVQYEYEPRQPGPEQAPQAVYERLLEELRFKERDLHWMHRLLGERLVEFDAFPLALVVRGDESHVSLTREVVAAPKPEPFPPMYGPEEPYGYIDHADGGGSCGTVRHLASAYPGETVKVLDD
jgi:hypothetical protein